MLASQELNNLKLCPYKDPKVVSPTWPFAPVVPTASAPPAPQAFSTLGPQLLLLPP